MSGAGKGDDYRKVDIIRYNDTLDHVFPPPECLLCKTNEYVEKFAGTFKCTKCNKYLNN